MAQIAKWIMQDKICGKCCTKGRKSQTYERPFSRKKEFFIYHLNTLFYILHIIYTPLYTYISIHTHTFPASSKASCIYHMTDKIKTRNLTTYVTQPRDGRLGERGRVGEVPLRVGPLARCFLKLPDAVHALRAPLQLIFRGRPQVGATGAPR